MKDEKHRGKVELFELSYWEALIRERRSLLCISPTPSVVLRRKLLRVVPPPTPPTASLHHAHHHMLWTGLAHSVLHTSWLCSSFLSPGTVRLSLTVRFRGDDGQCCLFFSCSPCYVCSAHISWAALLGLLILIWKKLNLYFILSSHFSCNSFLL